VRVRTYLGTTHLTFEEMLQVACPTCKAEPGQGCWYLEYRGHALWAPTQEPAWRPHKARREARLRLKEQLQQAARHTIVAALQEFDLREYLQLRAWLQAHVSLFQAPDLTKPEDPVLPWEHD
jgi:hypothetical protein